ncbi:MAG: phage integrase SAM-like domain-containing protein [Paramuribaculum sp.]|nr:phage integrase SAM-like domain-containing protein [Paramuribaculum sp.]
MTAEITTLSTEISIDELHKDIETRYSANSARYYRLMLGHLRKFNGSDNIILEEITPEYAEDFSDFLARTGMQPATVRQMLKFMRAAFKPYLSPECQRDFRNVFSSLDTRKEAWTATVSAADVFKIIEAESLPEPLDKIRLLFLSSLFACRPIGSRVEEHADKSTREVQLPQIDEIEKKFVARYGKHINDFAASLSTESLDRGLLAMWGYLHLEGQPRENAPVDAWIAVASSLGIDPDTLTASVPAFHPYARLLRHPRKITDEEKQMAFEKVANHVRDLREHWFAVRCLRRTPQEVNETLLFKLPLGEDETYQAFIVPPASEKVRKAIGASPIEKILFFRSPAPLAAEIRKNLPANTYLFTVGNTRRPAVISDSEMHTLMLLARISPQTLHSYFPDAEAPELELPVGKEVTITDGQFSGHVGIIKKVSSDRYTVTLLISTLGNLRITADIPTPFLTLPPNVLEDLIS